MSETPEDKMKHLDEMTLLLCVDRQLDHGRMRRVPHAAAGAGARIAAADTRDAGRK